ncbi:hypothetical protein PR202_gb21816 [Eleusine coracana subsp. coracana]|uniref:Peroxidase n=1 Tax=Eleusine coracana subsp. coracana TaxID=191504 RepID=A0AAV5FC35_ELECO|nr:hypothetical protein PR202_gb21816 [Eleusine coracana subsp. coracana]
MASNNKLVVLVVTLLLAFLGTVASQPQQKGPYVCFNGWLRLPTLNPQLCRPRPTIQPRRIRPPGQGLSYGYYNNNGSFCPSAERIIRDAVAKAVTANPGMAPGSFVSSSTTASSGYGCDGSVLLTTTASRNSDVEREGPPNKNSLRGFEVIDAAKSAIEKACPGIVSCADVVAFAARDASSVLSNGRINIKMPGGRLDGRESFANETDQLPGPFSNLTQLQSSFSNQGLTSDEMVTLSGAHTIGRGRCAFFSNRFGDMDPAFAAKLRAQCSNTNNFVNQDDVTPNVLDKQYYRNVIDKKVLFNSDAVLNSTETIAQVRQNANGATTWERKFEQAMENMGKIGVKTRGAQGAEIRKVCSRVN